MGRKRPLIERRANVDESAQPCTSAKAQRMGKLSMFSIERDTQLSACRAVYAMNHEYTASPPILAIWIHVWTTACNNFSFFNWFQLTPFCLIASLKWPFSTSFYTSGSEYLPIMKWCTHELGLFSLCWLPPSLIIVVLNVHLTIPLMEINKVQKRILTTNCFIGTWPHSSV